MPLLLLLLLLLLLFLLLLLLLQVMHRMVVYQVAVKQILLEMLQVQKVYPVVVDQVVVTPTEEMVQYHTNKKLLLLLHLHKVNRCPMEQVMHRVVQHTDQVVVKSTPTKEVEVVQEQGLLQQVQTQQVGPFQVQALKVVQQVQLLLDDQGGGIEHLAL
jgi:hypothetical protein